ncbi:cytochrome c [Psychroflexus sp. CAK8W]|uniref:Cytochrome c n=1 Tax=Psychroflexus longus TaxID=2873596 RepID=A0ABS7XHE5_9FLAO|nr:cytochrome c [Psychroflexus longus]MBZ9778378.1 cytochrome c [Psychroflexus longus]
MKLYIISFLFIFGFYINTEKDDSSIIYTPIIQEKDLQQSIKDGSAIYSDFCIRCHLAKGEGVDDLYPPLADSNWLSEKRKESIKSVKYGLNGEIEVNGKTYNNNMSSMGLTDREVADVMNYIINNFGNEKRELKQVTVNEVSNVTED